MVKKMTPVGLAVLILALSCVIPLSETPAAPQPSKAPSTAAAPKKGPAREIVNVQLLSMTMGSSSYVLSFALAEIVNKNSSWLRLACAETKGSVANLMTVVNEPALRKSTLFFTHEESNSWAREGRPPFKAPYKGARAIASMAETTHVFATLDKNIKTKADADGKRIMTMQQTTSTAVIDLMLFEIWGIKPKMSYGDYNATKDALMDGMIDIGAQPINGVPGIGYSPVPSLDEMMNSKTVYFLNIPAADIIAVAKKGDFDVYPHTIPARAIGDKQPLPVSGYSHSLSWWADESMSADIIYELTKTIYENAEKFKEYHRDGRMVTKKTMARIGVPEELFHPGALKFYKEKGIKLGIN